MVEVPDWRHRSEYIRTRSLRKGSAAETDIEPAWADEAFADDDAIHLRPDPASTSGRSDRTIGWSESAGFVITVITVREGEHLWGVNAWRSNTSEQNRYEEG